MNRKKFETLQRLYARKPRATAIAMPGIFARRFEWSMPRLHLALSYAIAIAVVSAIIYVAAINVIFLDGVSLQHASNASAKLARENEFLQQTLAERESPAWLESQSRTNGMISVGAVRYLTTDSSFALSR